MAISITPQQFETIKALNCSFRFFTTCQKFEMTPDWRSVVPVPNTSNQVHCLIIDKNTGKTYVDQTADDETTAFNLALDRAISAPKPLTPAQENAARLGQERDAGIAEANAAKGETEQLRKELADMKAMLAAFLSNQSKTPDEPNKATASDPAKRPAAPEGVKVTRKPKPEEKAGDFGIVPADLTAAPQ